MDKQNNKILLDKFLDIVGSFENEDYDNPFFIDTKIIWYSYPLMIKWKISERNKMNANESSNLISGINTSLIVDCASFVEGVMDEVLKEILCYKKYPAKDELKYRLMNNLEDRLENAQWTEYVKVFELIIGKSLRDALGNELWKSISTMFVFRNMIVHGKELQVEYYNDPNGKVRVVVPRKYNTVYSYLVEKKIINNKVKDKYERIDVLSNEVADHFFEISIQFLLKSIILFHKKERSHVESRILESINFTE